ncbi:MAG: hypothetical protein M1828_000024 [Chrysothrix sp. TS-e1954]|nr:MAG: hypothetical protein M1828_000024 [Chrysothrix sp. TS-e1954]
MARARAQGAPEPKRRSRFGCWPCKARKIKCGEEKPACTNCERQGEQCDYSIKLNWEIKGPKKSHGSSAGWSITGPRAVAPEISASRSYQGSPNTTLRPRPSDSPRRPASSGQLSSSRSLAMTPGTPGLSSPAIAPKKCSSDQSSYIQRLSDGSSSGIYSASSHAANIKTTDDHHRYDSTSACVTDVASYPSIGRSQVSESQEERSGKRVKVESTSSDTSGDDFKMPFNARSGSPSHGSSSFPQSFTSTPTLPSFTTTPTLPSLLPMPPTSSVDQPARPVYGASSEDHRTPEDSRKLSIKSLILKSEEVDPDEDDETMIPTLGFDQGRHDLDLPRNDDAQALTAYSPSSTLRQLDSDRFPSPSYAGSTNGFGFGLQAKDSRIDTQGYYAGPVPIRIPPSLQPLPDLLRENPMNLLYFHHFLNHTARILVPHDCPDNPFRSILPQLAVRNVNLLNLLLAYSASHRARFLKYEEPINRIANWVCEVFSTLRTALNSPSDPISDSTLATAIMLASLEIISPNAFEVAVPWHQHLTIAREMIIARGGYQTLSREDKVSYFLSRWFTYLDVLGSLSGSTYDRPLRGVSESLGAATATADSPAADSAADADLEIDCFLGFTTFCIRILARVADLAKQCDDLRVLPNGDVDTDWRAPSHIAEEAGRLQRKLEAPRPLVYRGCSHQPSSWSSSSSSTSPATATATAKPSGHRRRNSNLADYSEMVATNEAFHHAGLIHLHRRVLNKSSSSTEVQAAVRGVIEALSRISDGGTAEACMIFPMFSAGCEASDQRQQDAILQRMWSVEDLGMAQGRKARLLMQKVWETGKPWETLVTGEFFG